MSKTAHDLSVHDLLRLLNEKLGLNHTKLRERPFPPAVSTSSLVTEIESLETKARDVLRFILSLRNLLRPVNKLPPEIISQIARCLLNDDTRPIVPLTHVCRYWRESIISIPENWTLISSFQPGLAALSLERSKAAPLHLYLLETPTEPSLGLHGLLAPHIQRVGTLRIDDVTTIEDFADVLPNFPQSTPNLQSLRMINWGVEPCWDPATDPFGLFPNTLTSLKLRDIPLYPSFLELKTLTKLSLWYYKIRLPLDTLLNFVEDNRSLKSVTLKIDFETSPTSSPERRTAITNRLWRLSVTCWDVTTARFLISSIPLRRGAHLKVAFRDDGTRLEKDNILSDIPVTHFPNLLSPTFMEYTVSCPRDIRLIGPNGSLSYRHDDTTGDPFVEFSVLPLSGIQELCLTNSELPVTFGPSSFPVLKTLALKSITDLSPLFSALLPDPSFFPSLKTLGFLDCVVTEEFMGELTQFASNRKNTTSAWLHRVVIVQDGEFPSGASIHGLERHVSVVDVRFGKNLPTDLT